MRPQLVHHPAYVAALPAGHRFPMPKFHALRALLCERGLLDEAQLHSARPACRALLLGAHEPDYVEGVLGRRLTQAAVRRLGLPMTEAVVRRSLAAVGGTLTTARLALEHGLACNMAGGSHHAHPGFGSGFCVFNDVAVAARALLHEKRVRKVMVVDLDVHQGDGTAAICRGDPRIHTLSLHCRTNFPAHKAQSSLDVGLDPETGDVDYLRLLERLLPALLERQAPDLVFFNAGVDPHRDDRLGRLALSDLGLASREELVLEACRRRGIPLACVVGGGYAHDVDHVVRRHAILHEVARDLPDW